MELMFKLFFDNINLPVWIKGMDGRYTFANKAFENLFNKKSDEIVGSKIEDVLYQDMIEVCREVDRQVLESGEIVSREMYFESGYKQCTTYPIKDSNGIIMYIAGIIGVVSEENRMRAKDIEIEKQKMLTEKIIDVLPGTIFYKDVTGKYVYVNNNCKEFHIRRGQGSIIGKRDNEINFSKEQQEKFMKDDKIIIATKKPLFNETSFKDDDGSTMYNEVCKMPIMDDNGEVVGIVGRVLDITAKKKAQEELEYLSYTDVLTGIKNRTCFEVRQKELSSEKFYPLGLIMGDANGLKLINDTFGHIQGDKLLIHIANILTEICGNRGEVFRFGGDEFIVLIPNTTLKECEDIILNINNKCKAFKEEKFKVSISLGSSIKYSDDKDIYITLKEAEDKAYRQKLLQNDSIKSSILNSLKIGFGVSSGETEQHTERVAINAVKVGEKLGLELSELDELKIAADLHDIGKIGISEDILLKHGPLTEREYSIMKTHSEKGYRIIKASSELKNVAESVLYHHERWDGTGYPMGLKREGIPLLSRIISVCDSYDVMINERVYKKAMTKKEALMEIRRCAGTQFDPRVVEAFFECINE